jgi:hypothetical protein
MSGELVLTGERFPARHTVVAGELVREGERVPVVVKRTRLTWRQRLGTTKAERSFRTAQELLARGVATPEPLEVRRFADETWFVARRLEGATQVRAWFLHRDDPASAPAPPPIPFEEIVRALGRFARGMHDAGVFFRDLSDGNVLVSNEGESFRLWVVDLNRARVGGRVGRFRRLRDLSRPGLNRPEDLALLLDAYFAPGRPPSGAFALLRAFRARLVGWNRLKRSLRPWRR